MRPVQRPPTGPPAEAGKDRSGELGLVDAAALLGLVAGLLGDVPVLTVRVARDTVPVRVPSLPWPRHARSVDIAVQCDTDTPAAGVAERLGLAMAGSRRFASERAGVEFVESSWAGWLTTGEASRVGAPVSVTVSGSHTQ